MKIRSYKRHYLNSIFLILVFFWGVYAVGVGEMGFYKERERGEEEEEEGRVTI